MTVVFPFSKALRADLIGGVGKLFLAPVSNPSFFTELLRLLACGVGCFDYYTCSSSARYSVTCSFVRIVVL